VLFPSLAQPGEGVGGGAFCGQYPAQFLKTYHGEGGSLRLTEGMNHLYCLVLNARIGKASARVLVSPFLQPGWGKGAGG
jgi:hypothetical protein